jgi:hypothetical protein
MDQQLLQRGDIIRLEKGMKVCTLVPGAFAYLGSPFWPTPKNKQIVIGSTLKSGELSKDTIANKVKKGLAELDIIPDNEKVTAFIDALNLDLSIKSFDTSKYEGEYTVIRTALEGGGTGMGPHDVFPNGHHVICTKNDDPSIEVDFYQTSGSSDLLTDVPVVRRAAL